MKQKYRVGRLLVLALLLGACLWIAWNVPYTHDDWDWGLPIGLERWLSGELNNRYVWMLLLMLLVRDALAGRKRPLAPAFLFLLALTAQLFAENLTLVLAAAVLVFHLRVYWVIGGCSRLRAQLIQEAVEQGAAQVILPTEGWSYCYWWGRNPQSALRADYFRQFYGLPADVELVFPAYGSYEQWPDISQEMIDRAVVY